MWYVNTIAINKNEIFATTWLDLEGIMLREINQTEKAKYKMIHFYMESKKQASELKTKPNHSHRFR